MKTTKEMIEVMQAFYDEKDIEVWDTYNNNAEWVNTFEPIWNWERFKYRIKSEEVEHHENLIDFLKDLRDDLNELLKGNGK